MKNKLPYFIFVLLCCVTYGCSSTEIRAKYRRNHILELIKHINDNPILLHGDLTPAGLKLTKIGRPALSGGVLELLLSDERETRSHAKQVLYAVLFSEAGWRRGAGFPPELNESEMCREFNELWKSNGDYSEDSPVESRKASYLKWKQWLRDTDHWQNAKTN